MVNKILSMSGFELQIFCVGSDRSTKWATTTAQVKDSLNVARIFCKQIVRLQRISKNITRQKKKAKWWWDSFHTLYAADQDLQCNFSKWVATIDILRLDG